MENTGNPLQSYGSGAYGAAPIETLPLGYYLGLLTSEYRKWGIPIDVEQLTALFEDNFAIDAVQDPLNPVNWLTDLSGEAGNLNVVSDPSHGIGVNVCEADAAAIADFEAGQQYWAGNAPGDGFVQMTVGKATANGIPSMSYRTAERNFNASGYFVGYQVNPGPPSVFIAISPSSDAILEIPGVLLLQGDVLSVFYTGPNHVVYKNGAQIGSVVDGTYLAGGVGSVGLGISAVSPSDCQILDFKTGTAAQFISNNIHSGKLNALLYLLLKKFDDMSQCLVQMESAFDVDNALGVQLDAIGTIVGASRTLPFQPAGGLNPVLNDATYRIYLKARAAQNQWDGRIDSLQTIWQTLFPGGEIIIADNQNMTATIFLTGTFTPIVEQMILNGLIVPRPQGVLYDYAFNLPAFGFDGGNAFIAGFDKGQFV